MNPGRQVVVRTHPGPPVSRPSIAGTVQSSPIASLTEPPNHISRDFRRSPEPAYYPGYPQRRSLPLSALRVVAISSR